MPVHTILSPCLPKVRLMACALAVPLAMVLSPTAMLEFRSTSAAWADLSVDLPSVAACRPASRFASIASARQTQAQKAIRQVSDSTEEPYTGLVRGMYGGGLCILLSLSPARWELLPSRDSQGLKNMPPGLAANVALCPPIQQPHLRHGVMQILQSEEGEGSTVTESDLLNRGSGEGGIHVRRGRRRAARAEEPAVSAGGWARWDIVDQDQSHI